MKEAYLYKKLNNKLASPQRLSNARLAMAGAVQCNTCNHHCKIADGKRGLCGIRENRGGKLFLLTYGHACAANIDPIEKKPLYQFLPGTQTFTVATVGCNFRCLWCQNYNISQGIKHSKVKPLTMIRKMSFDLSPKEIVQAALKNNCPSISYSYTEPTVWLEYALDTMKLAHKAGLKNIWVSNGYMTKEALKLILPYLDAANVDIKTTNPKKFAKFCGAANPQLVLDNCQTMHKNKIHLEITTLIVPTFNDDEKTLSQIAAFISKKLSKKTPWHLSRYWPTYKMAEPATSLEIIKKAQVIGQKAGLKNIYCG